MWQSNGLKVYGFLDYNDCLTCVLYDLKTKTTKEQCYELERKSPYSLAFMKYYNNMVLISKRGGLYMFDYNK